MLPPARIAQEPLRPCLIPGIEYTAALCAFFFMGLLYVRVCYFVHTFSVPRPCAKPYALRRAVHWYNVS